MFDQLVKFKMYIFLEKNTNTKIHLGHLGT